MTGEDENQYEISTQQGEFILEKQFESHQNTQDSLFKLIRFIGLGLTGLVGIFSVITSINVEVDNFNENANQNINYYSEVVAETTAAALIFLTLIISALILTFLLFVIFVNTVRVVQKIIDGLESPALEPVESKHKVLEDIDEKNNIEEWINSNHEKISTSSAALDETYEILLKMFFELIVLIFLLFTFYSASPQMLGMFLSLILIVYWPYKFREKGELININQNFESEYRKWKFYATISVGVIGLYTSLFLYEMLELL